MIISFAYLVAFIIIILSLLYHDRKRRLSLLKRCGIPGPTPRFFDGNFFDFRGRSVLQKAAWLKEYGPDTIGYYTGSSPIILTKDVELIRRIQIKDFHLFANRKA